MATQIYQSIHTAQTIDDGICIKRTQENSKIGLRLLSENSSNHGDIGTSAIDLSYANNPGNYGALGDYSFATGYQVRAGGLFSFTAGYYTVAGYDKQFVVGEYNLNLSDSVFEVGNGDGGTQSNAFVVYTNGRIRAPELTIPLHDSPSSLVTKEYADTKALLPGDITQDFSGDNISANTFIGALTGNADTATSAGSATTAGSAAVATKLETPRLISLSSDVSGSVSFDGSSDVDIICTVQDDSHNHTEVTGDFEIAGDLTVQGTTTTLNTETLQVQDKNIDLGYIDGVTESDISADQGGITLIGDTNKTILWSNSTDSWEFNQPIISSLFTGNLTGDVTGNLTGDVTGTADTAENANLLDNLDSTSFLRSDEDDTFAGTLTITGDIVISGVVDGVDIAAEETRLQDTSGTNTGDHVFNRTNFTATADQTVFVVLGSVFTDAGVYSNGLREHDDNFDITDDGTDTTITFTTGNEKPLNTWVMIEELN